MVQSQYNFIRLRNGSIYMNKFITIIIVGIIAISGCATNKPIFLSEKYDAEKIKSIALIPIENATKEKAEIDPDIESRITMNLDQLGYKVIGSKKVKQVLERSGFANGLYYTATPKELSRILRTDAVLLSRLYKYRNDYHVFSRKVELEMVLVLFDSIDGEMLWKNEISTNYSATGLGVAEGLYSTTFFLALKTIPRRAVSQVVNQGEQMDEGESSLFF